VLPLVQERQRFSWIVPDIRSSTPQIDQTNISAFF